MTKLGHVVKLGPMHITSRQVAETRGVSHSTVMRMVRAGEMMPLEKLPGTTGAYLFDSAEVERAFKERKRRLAEGKSVA